MSDFCRQEHNLRVLEARSRDEVGRLARMLVRSKYPSQRHLDQLARAKEQAADQARVLAAHVAECPACLGVESA